MAALTPVVLDLETFWSPTHTLSKMNPILYCLHPETEIISISAKFGNHPTDVIFGEQNVIDALKKIDWSDKLVIAHNNSGFDAMILAWRCGVRPAMWGCTLAMAKPHFGKTIGVSLAALVEHYQDELAAMGIATRKDNSALVNTRGKHLTDFTPDELEAMKVYNRNDTEQCAGLFSLLLKRTSKCEMRLIDATIRMLVEPKFEVDIPMLEAALLEEQARKRQLLVQIGKQAGAFWPGMDDEDVITAAQTTLASAPKFAEFLRGLGVDVPMKPSPSNPEKMIPALSKTDEAFIALQDSDNELVALAASARLGVKSTQVETRLASFIAVAQACGGKMPIALAYYGGHTGRWGGALGLNQQNLPRIGRDKQGNIVPKISNALRMCLRAPKGYKVVVADLSGIELRVNHFLWKVESSMALYQESPGEADLYKDFATTLYNVAFDEVTKDQRQIGKVAHLGLGFGAGWKTFITIAKTMGGVDIDEGESKSIVSSWRRMYSAIQQGWKKCQNALTAIVTGATQAVDPWGLVVTTPEGFRLPSGRTIYYPELRQEVENGSATWKMGRGRNTTYLNGGKCDENIVQALARDVIADNMLEVKKLTGHWPVLSVHDELIYIVPDDEAESHLATVQGVMRTPPKWWPELVTWSEGDIAQSYGEAK